jgi:glycosyltransferase involved in cell wall biosynthesis
MRKLLMLTSSFPRRPGDFAGCFVADFARVLSNDFEIEVLSPPSQGAEKEEQHTEFRVYRFNYLLPKRAQLLDAAVDLQPLLERSLTARLQIIPFLIIFFFRVLLLARRVDIICSHWLVPAGLVGALVSRILKKPHIVIEHSGAFHLLRRLRAGRRIVHLIVCNSEKLVVVSDQLREQLIELCPSAADKVEVVPMGVENRSYGSDEPDDKDAKLKTILFLGRLAPVKGVQVLLDALSGCSNLQLIIAGDGDQRKYLENRALLLNVPVRFAGTVVGEVKEHLLHSCDLVVIPSIILPDGRTEGTPVVCLEAFAAGKAVIASAVGGLRELIVDGETGLLCEPGNSMQLRERILLLLNDDALRSTIGRKAAQIAKQYDWSKVAERYKTLLQQPQKGTKTKNCKYE